MQEAGMGSEKERYGGEPTGFSLSCARRLTLVGYVRASTSRDVLDRLCRIIIGPSPNFRPHTSDELCGASLKD